MSMPTQERATRFWQLQRGGRGGRYIRRVMETEDDFVAEAVCATCRQLEGLGK